MTLTPGRFIFADPSNETPPIVLAVANFVAVPAFPVTEPALPVTLPVTFPVRLPVTFPVKGPLNAVAFAVPFTSSVSVGEVVLTPSRAAVVHAPRADPDSDWNTCPSAA